MNKKHLWTVLLAFAMIGSVWAEDDAEPVNLALGAKATSSSVESERNPGFAVDGKLNTRWSAAYSDPQWIILDLGTPKKFQTIRLFWEAAYGKEYDLEISDDGETWKKIYEQKEGKGRMENIALEKPVTTRYFRFFGKKRGTEYGYSLWEIQLFAE